MEKYHIKGKNMTLKHTIGIRELVKDTSLLDKYDYLKIEDKKSHKLKGIFISSKYAKDIEEFLEKKKQKEIKEKLNALDSIVEASKTTHNDFLDKFDKDDPKVLQKVKGMME